MHCSIERRKALALLAGGLAACAAPPPQGARVFAAASLSDVMAEIAGSVRPAPVLSFAASSTLARQIEQGAPADLFLSADEAWMDYLSARGLIAPDSRVRLLSNALVLIAPADQPLRLTIEPGFALAAALGGGRLALADPEAVPAGRYARAALEHLGVWAVVEPRMVRAADVRGALRFVERGEAAAGIVYRTDALAHFQRKCSRGFVPENAQIPTVCASNPTKSGSDFVDDALAAGERVRIVGAFPAGSHPPILYSAALLQGARPEAAAFLAHLQSPQAWAVFERHGFLRP